MSIATQITRITGLRNRIRTKLIALGVLNNQNADLEDCTEAIEDMSAGTGELHYGVVSTDTTHASYKDFTINCGSMDNIKTMYLVKTDNGTFAAHVFSFFMTNPASGTSGTVYGILHGGMTGGGIITTYGIGLIFSITPDANGNMATLRLSLPSGWTNNQFDGNVYKLYYTYTSGLVNTSGIGTWSSETPVATERES